MKDYIRTFDINRRISIPKEILEELKIDYKTTEMKITIQDNKIVLEKV